MSNSADVGPQSAGSDFQGKITAVQHAAAIQVQCPCLLPENIGTLMSIQFYFYYAVIESNVFFYLAIVSRGIDSC